MNRLCETNDTPAAGCAVGTAAAGRLSGARAIVLSVLAALAGAGCAPFLVAGGAGAAAGAGVLLTASERRSDETRQFDSHIENAVEDAMSRTFADQAHVNVASYYRKVLLTGEVASEQDRQQAEALARGVPGTLAIFNELAVMGASSFSQRSNDAYVTSKVRTRLAQQNGVPDGAFRVLTERGTTLSLIHI